MQGDDEALMETIHLANIACGFHASYVQSLFIHFLISGLRKTLKRLHDYGQDGAACKGQRRPYRSTPITARSSGAAFSDILLQSAQTLICVH